MSKHLTGPVIGVIAVVAILFLAGAGWVMFFPPNGETHNANAGHSTMPEIHQQTHSQTHGLDVESYKKLLKVHRPDLSDAEIDAKAQAWLKIRQGS